MVNTGRARLKGSMMNRKENNRNIKRAGCVSSVGRPVQIASGNRCCCKKKAWCLGKNRTNCIYGKKYVKISFIK